jgi:hypothetical protein
LPFYSCELYPLCSLLTGCVLVLCRQVRYRSKKSHLPGPTWTIPVIGKFLDSMKPSIENYKAGWDLGELSVASVFHMYDLLFRCGKVERTGRSALGGKAEEKTG